MERPHFFIVHDPGSSGFCRLKRPKKSNERLSDYKRRIEAILTMRRPNSFQWNAKVMARQILLDDDAFDTERAMAREALSQL